MFAAEVERAVLEGRADIAVHSAKDVPSAAPLAGLVLAATPERVDVRDALVGGALGQLPPGALVATGSTRRRRPARLGAARSRIHRAARQYREPALEGTEERRGRGRVRGSPTAWSRRKSGRSAFDRRGLAASRTGCARVALSHGRRGCPGDLRSDRRRACSPCGRRGTRPFLPGSAEAATRRSGRSRPAQTPTRRCISRRSSPATTGTRSVRGAREGDDPVLLGQALADDLLDHRGGRALIEPWAS